MNVGNLGALSGASTAERPTQMATLQNQLAELSGRIDSIIEKVSTLCGSMPQNPQSSELKPVSNGDIESCTLRISTMVDRADAVLAMLAR